MTGIREIVISGGGRRRKEAATGSENRNEIRRRRRSGERESDGFVIECRGGRGKRKQRRGG